MPSKPKNTILIKAMASANHTQTSLAVKAGVARQTLINAINFKRIRADRAYAIAKALGHEDPSTLMIIS